MPAGGGNTRSLAFFRCLSEVGFCALLSSAHLERGVFSVCGWDVRACAAVRERNVCVCAFLPALFRLVRLMRCEGTGFVGTSFFRQKVSRPGGGEGGAASARRGETDASAFVSLPVFACNSFNWEQSVFGPPPSPFFLFFSLHRWVAFYTGNFGTAETARFRLTCGWRRRQLEGDPGGSGGGHSDHNGNDFEEAGPRSYTSFSSSYAFL